MEEIIKCKYLVINYTSMILYSDLETQPTFLQLPIRMLERDELMKEIVDEMTIDLNDFCGVLYNTIF